MRRCPRCEIVFHERERSRCLYCDTLLMEANKDETDLGQSIFDDGKKNQVIQEIIDDHAIRAESRLQFIVASYFRLRTFDFMYRFMRDRYKKGPKFPRELVQPFNLMMLLNFPWLIVNILDSFLMRIFYTKYCPKCGWKFYRFDRREKKEHDHEECEYNREHNRVVESILSGDILFDEQEFKRLGMMKKAAKRKSAYWDLCTGKSFSSAFLDIMCVWFSVCVWLILFVSLAFPLVMRGVYRLDF